jgi:hypothetical protein
VDTDLDRPADTHRVSVSHCGVVNLRTVRRVRVGERSLIPTVRPGILHLEILAGAAPSYLTNPASYLTNPASSFS